MVQDNSCCGNLRSISFTLLILAILLMLFDFLIPKDFYIILAFQSLEYELSWRRFFQKHVVRSKLERNESGRFGALKSDSTHHFFRNACTKSGSLQFSQFFGLLTDFVCLYTYEFWLSLCKIVRSWVILLLPLLDLSQIKYIWNKLIMNCLVFNLSVLLWLTF